MLVLRLLRAILAKWFFDWAAREIPPMHPDVSEVIQRRLYWTAQLKNLLRALS